jgi:hypothetical protein
MQEIRIPRVSSAQSEPFQASREVCASSDGVGMNRLDREIEECELDCSLTMCRSTSFDDNETIKPFLLDLRLS